MKYTVIIEVDEEGLRDHAVGEGEENIDDRSTIGLLEDELGWGYFDVVSIELLSDDPEEEII